MMMRKPEMKTREEMPTWRMMVMRPSNSIQPHPCHHSCCPRLRRVQVAAQEKEIVFPSMKKRIACSHHQLIPTHTFNRSGHLHLRLCQNPSRVVVHWSHGSLWRTLLISRMTSCKDGVALSRS